MGRIIDLRSRRPQPAAARTAGPGAPSNHGMNRGAAGNAGVTCASCGEQHPVVRLADGTRRCVTAFEDGPRWFCRNRGCRAAWLARHPHAER